MPAKPDAAYWRADWLGVLTTYSQTFFGLGMRLPWLYRDGGELRLCAVERATSLSVVEVA